MESERNKILKQRVAELTANNAILREAFEECIQSIADWGTYASPYFQEKHDLQGEIDRFNKVLSETPETSLAEIQADAIRDAREYAWSKLKHRSYDLSLIIKYENKLRGNK